MSTSNWISDFKHALSEAQIPFEAWSDSVWSVGAHKLQLVSAGEASHLSSDGLVLHEDVYQRSKLQVISRLRALANLNTVRIHGRNTRAVILNKEEARAFIQANHLMGFGGGKVFTGLLHGDDLVAVAVFSGTTLMKYENPPYYSTELERYASQSGTTVTGGLDKLIQFFLKEYVTDDLVTSVDLEWSHGKSYLGLGFEPVQESLPLQFAVNRSNWTRRVITAADQLNENEYRVINRGNLKLRKWINRVAD